MKILNTKIEILKIGVLLLAILILTSCAGKKKEEQYKTTKITRGSIMAGIPTSGTVMPRNRLEIKPPIPGRIEQVLVNEGDNVRQGQILLWLSSNDRATLLDAARAQGEAEYQKWLEVYKPAPIVAPLNGFIILRGVEPGQSVGASDAVLVMADKLIVKAQVDETDIGSIHLNQPVSLVLDAYPESPIPGHVSHIAYESTIINNVIIYEVDVLPDRVPLYFRSGMSVTVNFEQESRSNVLLLPINALRKSGKNSYAFVKGSDGQIKTLQVQTGIENTEHVELISGLNEGDEVIIPTNDLATRLLSRNRRGPNFNPFGRQAPAR
jgi:membrane fusion protein, macrolide-specific efflux system